MPRASKVPDISKKSVPAVDEAVRGSFPLTLKRQPVEPPMVFESA